MTPLEIAQRNYLRTQSHQMQPDLQPVEPDLDDWEPESEIRIPEAIKDVLAFVGLWFLGMMALGAIEAL